MKGVVCQYNYADQMSMRPNIEQGSLMVNANLDVTEGVDTFLQVMGTVRDIGDMVLAPSPAGALEGFQIRGSEAKSYLNTIDKSVGAKAIEAIEGIGDTDLLDMSYRIMRAGKSCKYSGFRSV